MEQNKARAHDDIFTDEIDSLVTRLMLDNNVEMLGFLVSEALANVGAIALRGHVNLHADKLEAARSAVWHYTNAIEDELNTGTDDDV